MFPAYPLLYFNAAVTLYLVRGWLEVAFIKVTNSPYRVSFEIIHSCVLVLICLVTGISIITFQELHVLSGILALWHCYHAPLALAFDFQHTEIPRLLNTTGLLPIYPENMPEEDKPPIDLSPIKKFDLKLCLGKEWHRFPGSYLVPSGVQVELVKSEFNRMLPRHFETEKTKTSTGEENDSLWA